MCSTRWIISGRDCLLTQHPLSRGLTLPRPLRACSLSQQWSNAKWATWGSGRSMGGSILSLGVMGILGEGPDLICIFKRSLWLLYVE